VTYWKATVERPDGEGGWQLVGVFGTPTSKATGTGRHLHGDTPLDAARLLLSHVWPINLSEPGRYERPDVWTRDREASTGIADHRITIEVGDRKWDLEYGKERPEPLVITVAQMQLDAIRRLVAESVTASAKAAELAAQPGGRGTTRDTPSGGSKRRHATRSAPASIRLSWPRLSAYPASRGRRPRPLVARRVSSSADVA